MQFSICSPLCVPLQMETAYRVKVSRPQSSLRAFLFICRVRNHNTTFAKVEQSSREIMNGRLCASRFPLAKRKAFFPMIGFIRGLSWRSVSILREIEGYLLSAGDLRGGKHNIVPFPVSHLPAGFLYLPGNTKLCSHVCAKHQTFREIMCWAHASVER